MICAGLDAGSRTIKIVLMDDGGREVIAKGMVDQGTRQEALAEGLLDNLLDRIGAKREDVACIVATGYGRDLLTLADTTVTEITCHGVGVRRLVPDAATIIDIGGQDSKLMRLDESGAVRDFSMNDRCAAGTGCFLEVVARRLGVSLESLGEMARKSRNPASISSKCVVFAETEIVGLLASGAAVEDIVAGVQAAIATRIQSLAGRNVTDPVVFTGGVALIPGMDGALAKALQRPVKVCPEPQMTGALGAAVLAARRLK